MADTARPAASERVHKTVTCLMCFHGNVQYHVVAVF